MASPRQRSPLPLNGPVCLSPMCQIVRRWLIPFRHLLPTYRLATIPSATEVGERTMTAHRNTSQATAESEVDSHRPDPTPVQSPAELVNAMRSLKGWSGLSYRQLEKRAAQEGIMLPRSTLLGALSRDSLPREELVAGFVRACGYDEREAMRWVQARRRLAADAAARASHSDDEGLGDESREDTRTGPAAPPGTAAAAGPLAGLRQRRWSPSRGLMWLAVLFTVIMTSFAAAVVVTG